MFIIYNLFLIFAAIILSPIVILSFIFVPKFRAGFWQKIGFLSMNESGKKSIWVHAVSVGEINATEALIKRIKQDFPQYNLVVTTVTATGQEVANIKLGETADMITYFPYDFSFAAKSAIKAFDPALVIIAETEIWPGVVNQLSKRKIPMMLVNGRISPGSFKGYRKARWFFKYVLNNFSKLLMQTERDKDRIVGIGASEYTTEVMGNLKFDITKNLDDEAVQQLKDSLKVGNNRVMIAGSTHKGEDEMVLRVFNRLKTEFKDLKLLLAPRHPERNEDVYNLINSTSYTAGKRSEQAGFDNNDIIMLDTMGELGQLYSISHVAFIGGSFSGTGGHNPLEPAIYGVPVVSGDTVFNFKDIYKFMTTSRAAKLVKNEAQLHIELKKLLESDDNYNQASKACFDIFEKNKGALDFAIDKIKNYI